VVVFLLLYRLLPNHVYHEQPGVKDQSGEESPPGNWSCYFLLVIAGVLFGFIYASFTHFLPRYLDSANLRPAGMTAASTRTLLSGVVLLCGAAGQAFAGRIARPDHLNKFYLLIVLCNVPALLLMAVSQGAMRLVSTCLLAFVHFMNQPIYNSILPQLVPRSRRSLGYGFSNMMCFGLGALGPSFAGRMPNDFTNYSVLAGVALLTAGIVFLLGRTMASTTSLTPGS